jgi:hypothetical protein
VTKQQSMAKAGGRKANKTEEEFKASDGHNILFTFIVHTRQENSTISKKKKKK